MTGFFFAMAILLVLVATVLIVTVSVFKKKDPS